VKFEEFLQLQKWSCCDILKKVVNDCIDYLSSHEFVPWNNLLGSPPSKHVTLSTKPIPIDEDVPPPVLDVSSFERYLRRWKSMRSDPTAVMREIDELVRTFDVTQRKRKSEIVCVNVNGLNSEIRFAFSLLEI